MKFVRDKQSEMSRKLDALRRKYDKEKKPASSKFYVGNKLVKRLSSKQIDATASTEEETASGYRSVIRAERDLRFRYHQAIYTALEKHVRNEQQHQMKNLYDSLEAEKKDILTRLANSRKEDVKALAKKTNRDKDEINRRKREIHSLSVQRGVAECCCAEKRFADRREKLERTHERLLQLLMKHRDKEMEELERMGTDAAEG